MRNACFPSAPGALSRSLTAHTAYAEAQAAWLAWLTAGHEPSNAEQLTLYQVIRQTVERRRPSGAWADMDDRIIPPADVLENVLDRDKYDAFGTQIETLRRRVEETGRALCELLGSNDLAEELDAYSYEAQLDYLATLLDQLPASNVGMLFIRKSIHLDQSPLPAVHPDRITRKPIKFLTSDLPGVRRAAKLWIHAAMKMLPALVKDQKPDKLTGLLVDFIGRYFPDDLPAAQDFEQRFANAKAYLRDHPDLWKSRFDLELAGRINMFFEVVNVVVAVRKTADRPSFTTVLGLVKSITGLGSAALSTKWERATTFVATDLGKAVKCGLAETNAVLDVITAAVEIYASAESYENGDLSVAAGHALQGVGLATGAVIAGVDAAATFLAADAVLAFIPGLQVIALGALVAVFVGALLVAYTEDTKFESWLQNSWFGNRWENVDAEAGPEDVWFRAKRVDGTPDIGRQLSTYLATLYPPHLTARIGEHTPLLVGVECKPVLAYASSEVDLWRLADTSGPLEPAHWVRIPVFRRPWTLGRLDDQRVFPDPPTGDPDRRIDSWVASFGPLEWSNGTNPGFDMTGQHIELEIVIPDQLAPQIVEAVGGGEAGQDFSFPYVVRSRVEVTPA
ncbi:hypothetical protein GCM10020358_49090 [Amorphoplanes nipponensis]|uniref:Uncharacterized protein n=1 Tax=Actinoplanes nipponensis TaxID=135950 RepID=A0A919MQ09_9ACTN|nr:hypothetical protein [Actinoplanes nipponensis]GIE53166.1 hypothetical protein Ani05nite_67000 [Actinoplanes nipponensis]